MPGAGTVDIVLHHRRGRVRRVGISASRPAAAKVLIGKTPAQVLDIVPLLFSLCGHAQSHAALQACRSALGLAAEARAEAGRNLLVQIETLREHAWQILLAWPRFIGQQPDKTSLAALLKIETRCKQSLFPQGAFKLDSAVHFDTAELSALIGELRELIDTAVFSGGLQDFLHLRTEADLLAWLQENSAMPAALLLEIYRRQWPAAGQNPVDCLPAADSAQWAAYLQEQDMQSFTRQPHWQGRLYESTVLNRQWRQPLIEDLQGRYRNGFWVRMVARLLEVASIPWNLYRLMQDGDATPMLNYPPPGSGLGMVQAARGLLIHRLQLQQGRVQDYAIVAPTEWNFQPQGVVAQGLAGLQAANAAELDRQAQLLIESVDPCVKYQLQLCEEESEAGVHA